MRLKADLKEADILKSILEYLSYRDVLAWRVPGQGNVYTKNGEIHFRRSSTVGFPDIACLFKGVFICLEVKTKKGVISKYQKHWIDTLNDHGAIARVVRSVDNVIKILEEVEAKL